MVKSISDDNETSLENETTSQDTEEGEETPGMRLAAINSDPTISLEEARNAAAGEGSNGAGSVSSSAEDYVPSTSDPYPTNLPSTDHPLPDDSENPDEEVIGASESSPQTGEAKYTH